jgi:exopolysaccharide biosynthesis polyprenyl glycosylphosphotransferase
MIRLRHKLLIHLLRLFDQATVVLCVALFGNAFADRYELHEVSAILLVLIGSMFLFNHFVRYDVNRFTEFAAQLRSLLMAVTATVVLLPSISLLLSFPDLSATGMLLVWVSATALLAASRFVVRELLKYSRRLGMTSRQLLIVGCNERAQQLAAKFERCPELGYRILGFVAEDGVPLESAALGNAAEWSVCGRIADLQSILERASVDEVLICLPVEHHFLDQITKVIRLGEQLGIVVRVIADPEHEALLRRMHLEFFDGRFVLTFFREGLLFQLMLKRLLDVTATLLLLVLLSPLMLVVALIIKITSPGPVVFVQERMGMNRRRVNLYNFRSMLADADSRRHEIAHLNEMDGPVFKIKNDPRVTPFGRFIRRTSIVELPQLFNVLSGSMSLVGPRPPLPSEVEQYEWLFQRRLSIKPGITCLWQVSGRNKVGFRDWMELDRQYVTNWSFWLDLKILFRTIPVVLAGRGAS